jgi:hypothetical protein
MVRLSILLVTMNEIRVGKLALIVPVMTSTEGRCVAVHDVDAGGAGHLGEALDRALDLLAGDHHQVGHLVDDHDDVGQRRRGPTPRSSKIASPESLVEAGLDRAGDDLSCRGRLRHS